MGPYLKSLQKQRESGVEISMLDEAPQVIPEAAYYLKAFEHLSTSRGKVDAGYLPITVMELESYCRLVGERDPLELMDIIQPLDRQFLNYYS